MPIWDSLLYRFGGHEVLGDTITLFASTITFKEALVWGRYETEDTIPAPLSAVVLPKTSDQYYLLGKRAPSLIYKEGEVCLIGGILSRDEIIVSCAY